ncbi:MAG: hypothetical protein U0232_22655 [Thermomicrobiales bacterium]
MYGLFRRQQAWYRDHRFRLHQPLEISRKLPGDQFNTVTLLGYNARQRQQQVRLLTATGDLNNANPLALGDYTGPTQTMALLPGSYTDRVPAAGAGCPAGGSARRHLSATGRRGLRCGRG